MTDTFRLMATTVLRTRVDRARARKAEKIFKRIGLKPAAAFDLFLAKVVAVRGLPFPVTESDDGYLPHVPNADTVAALKARGGKKFKDADSALAWLRDEND
ncbi:MAG: type II toxin-antitoxin system RelB/DinJ family antitoxin [Opitutaceae bacterium]